jgi:hypothetical protein
MLNNRYEVDKKRLKQTILELQELGERRTWDGQEKASLYILRRLKKLDVKFEIYRYKHKGQSYKNILVQFPGNCKGNSRIIIVAHYDSTIRNMIGHAPGADDNGSGVAVLMELIRFFKKQNYKNDLQLVFLSNEEHGRAGSKAFVKMLIRQNIQLIGVLNVDIVGYNNPMAIFSSELFKVFKFKIEIITKSKMIAKMLYNFGIRFFVGKKILKVVVRPEDKHLIQNDKKLLLGDLKKRIEWIVTNPRIVGDEVSFWDEGYSAVSLNSLYRNPYAETPEDKVKYVSIDTVFQAVHVAVFLIKSWSDKKFLFQHRFSR